MTDQQPRGGFKVDIQPHAYDPIAHPELFEGVLTRRVLAFVIDVLIITIPIILVCIFIFLFGIFTLGFGWLLFWLVSPASVIWAIAYYGITMGSPASATYGMRTFDLAERFALIICPFRAFLHNVTEADRVACLARVRQHLRPSGRFAFNVFHPSLTFMSQHAGTSAGVWRWTGTSPLPSGGWVVQSEANQYDTVAQVVHSLHRYDVFGASGALERTAMLRLQLAYLYPSDIRRLLESAGF